ncbi:hypothetical protein GTO89_13080 [Heliobacterium gestii]|uniref:Uncharacterized protein n=1 Tax=Heliomicrobium gestii TaxID=2699 RepID=A0A845LHR3_HELGE|nr:hypothetical protein [Heliomicrobium gestii]MBM7867487.1 hypothetical protein [Heliomicrobium gestii]MZP43965.1 hypothetical protein [Heliomicrobium gestii]
METLPASTGFIVDQEYLSTVLFVLITTTVELVKYMMKRQSEKFKVLLPFVLLGAGFLWGGLYGLWMKEALSWSNFKHGAEYGVYVACVSGVSYGMIKSFRQVRDGMGVEKNGGDGEKPPESPSDEEANKANRR